MTLDRKTLHPDTRLIHPVSEPAIGFKALSSPIHRASTVVFDNTSIYKNRNTGSVAYAYGLKGTPTSRELEIMMADNDGGIDCTLVPSGLAALALVNMALLSSGDHVLMPDNSYDPNVAMAEQLLRRWGITFDIYDPIDLSKLTEQFKPNTKLIWVETPGSGTLEVADLPAIAAIAHAKGALVATDNTWAAGRLLNAFAKGADVSIQAMTKYQGGHADVLMGSVVWNDAAIGEKIVKARSLIGFGVGADDCWLMLRGLQTMQLRLKAQGEAALELAQWLGKQPWVQTVLHPALPSCLGHDVWKRDFTGAAGLFSFLFRADISPAQADKFIEYLELFSIGVSWAGTKSLALHFAPRRRFTHLPQGELVRLGLGLEHINDLRNDLAQAALRCGF